MVDRAGGYNLGDSLFPGRFHPGGAAIPHITIIVFPNPAGSQILADFIVPMGNIHRVHALLARFRESAQGQDHWAGELRSLDGKRTLRGVIAPLVLPGGRTDTMLVFEDITEFMQELRTLVKDAKTARQST